MSIIPPLIANCPTDSTNSVLSYPINKSCSNKFLLSTISPSFNSNINEEKVSFVGILSSNASIESTSIVC